MSHGSLWQRLVEGTRWAWLDDRYRDALPADLDATVMALESRDRFHAKQGRSTARVVFRTDTGELPVYLKRHYRLPWTSRLAALVQPGGRHSPGSAEWAHLRRARALGIAVPDLVAAGEWIGPWGALQSYLVVAELTGCRPLHEAIPTLAGALALRDFAALKRKIIAEMAEIAATLHRNGSFHQDLYLCHFYLDMRRLREDGGRLTLIDLHRLAEHRWWSARGRWKDLGQLLFSTYGVAGIDDRDRLRFWKHYRRLAGTWWPRWQSRAIRLKAARYLAHDRSTARRDR
jgi:heptose I phosphotransferase